MNNRLKIGQEVLIRGYVDEIRKDTIIIRNDGGYFGTVQEEISVKQEPCEDAISRQAVLDGVDRYIYKSQSTGTQDDFYSFAELVVKQLPSVTPQPKTDILDKIRAEIKGWQVDIHDNEYDADKHDFVFERIFEIIDEYKAESEE